jgi:hypothetical protein
VAPSERLKIGMLMMLEGGGGKITFSSSTPNLEGIDGFPELTTEEINPYPILNVFFCLTDAKFGVTLIKNIRLYANIGGKS